MSLSVEQLEARKLGVGCSETLAAIGKDSRLSRQELYQIKVGERPAPEFKDNERILFGQLLEPVIRGEFSRRIGHEVIVPKRTLFHPTAPLLGHPDGWIPALNRGVELKTADKFEAEEFGEEDSDQVPVRYLVQCAGYMAITDTDSWYLCVLIGGNDLRTYVIPRDREIEAAVLAGVTEFWSHVATRTPPEPHTPEEVRMRWPKDIGGIITATPEIQALCVQLGTVKRERKKAEAQEEELAAEVQKFMGELANLHAPGQLKPLATWRTAKPSLKFDNDKFERECPTLYRQYQRDVPGSRRFLLK